MAVLAVQKPVLTGVAFTKAAATAGGDSFPNTGVEMFHVSNGHATLARTVTVDAPGTCNFGLPADPAHDAVVVVPAVSSMVIGPFNTSKFNDANGRVQITYSASGADLTVAVQAPA